MQSASAITVTNEPISGKISGPNNVTMPVEDTLDEPVSATIVILILFESSHSIAFKQWRDLKNIGYKLKQVLWPVGNTKNILKDWDLWGPLLLCLALSM